MLIHGQMYLHFQEMSPSYRRCNYGILLAVPRPMLNIGPGSTWTRNPSPRVRTLHWSGHRTMVWREIQESLSTAIQLYLSTAINHLDELTSVHIITSSYSCIAAFKVSRLPRNTAVPWPNRHGARTQSEKLQVWILLGPMLSTGLGTASSILKLCLHFIISPYTASIKTETMISIDIFMINGAFTNHGILWNSFSSHCSIEKHCTYSIYCVVLTKHFIFEQTPHLPLSLLYIT